jgi:hypothetical protein
VQDVIETCAVRGLMMKSSAHHEECEYSHVPLSLFPTPYPIEHYQKSIQVQEHMATMVATLVRQPEYIHEILRYFKEQDPFLKRLVNMSIEYNTQAFK